jgi:predicted Zn-dependent protease
MIAKAWVGRGIVLLIVVAASLGAPALGEVTFNERKPGLWGAVTTMDEEPLEGAKITLTPKGAIAAPLSATSNSRGRFVFPRLQLLDEGYEIDVELEGYFVRKFHIRTRRGTREIWQDDRGTLPPDQQTLPALKYRGGRTNATMHLMMMKIEEYQPPSAKKKQPEKPAAPQAPARRELTPYEEAQEALALGEFDRAETKLREALEDEPGDVEMRWDLAKTLARQEDYAAAMREANKVLRAEPEKPRVRLLLASWMGEMGQTAAVIPYLEKERELSPQDTDVYRLLVEAYKEAGRDEDARGAIEGWVEAAPEDSEALVALAMARSQEGDYAGAEELFRKVAAQNPEKADTVFYNIGASIMNQDTISAEDRKRAVAAFEQALEANPENARAHIQMGYALIGLGERQRAKEHFQRFVELAPDDPRAAEAKNMIQALGAS